MVDRSKGLVLAVWAPGRSYCPWMVAGWEIRVRKPSTDTSCCCHFRSSPLDLRSLGFLYFTKAPQRGVLRNRLFRIRPVVETSATLFAVPARHGHPLEQ